ncbi:MAG TPA: hypothetical protein PKZ32_04540 [Candidatus Melainabacteria bacterium]|nr:hypothetical protein [Candidatus Melainabacteria bacterium]
MSEEKGNSKLVKIGGALIILAAFGIMLPAVFQFVAGIGRMVILIVVALGLAYVLNMLMARQALEKARRAKTAKGAGTEAAAEAAAAEAAAAEAAASARASQSTAKEESSGVNGAGERR